MAHFTVTRDVIRRISEIEAPHGRALGEDISDEFPNDAWRGLHARRGVQRCHLTGFVQQCCRAGERGRWPQLHGASDGLRADAGDLIRPRHDGVSLCSAPDTRTHGKHDRASAGRHDWHRRSQKWAQVRYESTLLAGDCGITFDPLNIMPIWRRLVVERRHNRISATGYKSTSATRRRLVIGLIFSRSSKIARASRSAIVAPMALPKDAMSLNRMTRIHWPASGPASSMDSRKSSAPLFNADALSRLTTGVTSVALPPLRCVTKWIAICRSPSRFRLRPEFTSQGRCYPRYRLPVNPPRIMRATVG